MYGFSTGRAPIQVSKIITFTRAQKNSLFSGINILLLPILELIRGSV